MCKQQAWLAVLYGKLAGWLHFRISRYDHHEIGQPRTCLRKMQPKKEVARGIPLLDGDTAAACPPPCAGVV